MLILTHFVDSVISCSSQLVVFLTQTMQVRIKLVRKGVGLVLPGITDFDQVKFLFIMDKPKLAAAALSGASVRSNLLLKMLDHLRLFLFGRLKLLHFALQLEVSFATCDTSIFTFLEAVIVPTLRLTLQVHIAHLIN